MPRDRSKKKAAAAASSDEDVAPAPAPAPTSVNESVEAPADSETEALVTGTPGKAKYTRKERPGAPVVDLPDVDVDKVTVGVSPQTHSLCYCCCVEGGLYWE